MNQTGAFRYKNLVIELLLWSFLFLSVVVWVMAFWPALNIFTEFSVKGLDSDFQQGLQTRARFAVLFASTATLVATLCAVALRRRRRHLKEEPNREKPDPPPPVGSGG